MSTVNGHGARVELFQLLLGVDVDVGESVSEPRVRVIPPYEDFQTATFFEHHRFDGDTCVRFRDGEDVCVLHLLEEG